MDLNRETLASDVLESWTPDLPDVHPDDVERAYDDDGAPILRCPMVPASHGNATMDGAIEGAGGTWWRPKSSAWSVEPSRIRALSPRGRAWLKATHARLAHYTTPGETDQKCGPLSSAVGRARDVDWGVWNKAQKAARWTPPTATFYGVCVETGAVVLTLGCGVEQARKVVAGYGIAGRPLTLRPA